MPKGLAAFAPVSMFSVPPLATASLSSVNTGTSSVAVSMYRLFMFILAMIPWGCSPTGLAQLSPQRGENSHPVVIEMCEAFKGRRRQPFTVFG